MLKSFITIKESARNSGSDYEKNEKKAMQKKLNEIKEEIKVKEKLTNIR